LPQVWPSMQKKVLSVMAPMCRDRRPATTAPLRVSGRAWS
jgi:hypothetical protein